MDACRTTGLDAVARLRRGLARILVTAEAEVVAICQVLAARVVFRTGRLWIFVDSSVVVAIVNQILRHVALAGAAAVTLAAADAAGPALARLSGNRPPEKQPDGTLRAGAPVWLGAPIDLAWGPYFEPSATDRKEAVETATKANGGRPVVSQRAAVASVAPLFGTEDVDAEVAAIDGDEGAQREAVHATMRAIGGEEKPAEPEAPEVTMAPPVEVDAPADVAAADAATAAPPVEKAADAALNGAQVSSMVDVVVKVATGELPRDAAKAIIKRAFLVDDAGADEILLDVIGKSYGI